MTTLYPPPAVRLRVLVCAKRDNTKLERIVLAVIMDCTRRASAMPLLARNAYWGPRYSQRPLPSATVIAARARIWLCRIHSNVTFVHRMHTPIPRIPLLRAPNVLSTRKQVVPRRMRSQTVFAPTISQGQMVGHARLAKVESTKPCWALLHVWTVPWARPAHGIQTLLPRW